MRIFARLWPNHFAYSDCNHKEFAIDDKPLIWRAVSGRAIITLPEAADNGTLYEPWLGYSVLITLEDLVLQGPRGQTVKANHPIRFTGEGGWGLGTQGWP